jgi:KipI family sensor histidine kinase inhibitor
MIIQRYAENALRIVFGNQIDMEVHEQVRQAFFLLLSLRRGDFIDIIPSFCSLLVTYDDNLTSYDILAAFLKERLADLSNVEMPSPQVHEIPVHYGGDNGPDLSFVAKHCGLDIDEVIARHCAEIYTVFTVGFTPGFPYLGTLDESIAAPRLETPRTRIPAGSVGIAQRQTGIYPFESPAGWRIIGRTDVRLFDPARPPYSMMQIGDKVRFMEER